MVRPISEDYSGRQSDIEILQHISIPDGVNEMSLSSTNIDSRKVAGTQKAVQRYVRLLLTPDGTRHFDDAGGNDLLSALVQGTVQNTGYLRHLFVLANAAVLDEMHDDDYNTETYGELPDDEKIASVTMRSATVDTSTGTVSLSLDFETEAGSGFTYIVPISTGTK